MSAQVARQQARGLPPWSDHPIDGSTYMQPRALINFYYRYQDGSFTAQRYKNLEHKCVFI